MKVARSPEDIHYEWVPARAIGRLAEKELNEMQYVFGSIIIRTNNRTFKMVF